MILGKNAKKFDQFFTKDEIALNCVNKLKEILNIPLEKFDAILEPSCGNGAFVKILPSNTLYYDIDLVDSTRRVDFFKLGIPSEYNEKKIKWLTIGNPPFGQKSSAAISFFNRAAEFSSIIAFILPRTFCKSSVQDKLNRSYFLVYEYTLPENSFTFEDKDYDVPCNFQVWVDYNHFNLVKFKKPETVERNLTPKLLETPDFYFVNFDQDPDLTIRRNGVLAGKIFINEKWTSKNHYYIKIRDRNKVEEVIKNLRSLDLENLDIKYATAGYPSISKTELCNLYNNKINENELINNLSSLDIKK